MSESADIGSGLRLTRIWVDEFSMLTPDQVKSLAVFKPRTHTEAPHRCRRGRIWWKKKRILWLFSTPHTFDIKPWFNS